MKRAPKVLVIVIGPPAVGKMAVGYELAKLTGLKLFHGHASIEAVWPVFDFGTPQFNKLVVEIRKRMFQEVVASELPGLIFTYMCAFDLPTDIGYMRRLTRIFLARGGKVYYLELEASLVERLKRNSSPWRLRQKPSKRDTRTTRKMLLRHERKYVLNSPEDFRHPANYLKIDNTRLSARKAARKAMRHFKLTPWPRG